MEKTLENRLRECFANPEAERETAAYRQTLLLTKREARRRAERQRAGFGSFLVWHMKHSGIRIWFAQAGMLLCIGMLLLRIYDLSYLCTQRHISMLLCGLAVFIFMTALPVFYRSSRYKMQEIEAASKLSVSRLFLAEMITITIGDTVMIGTVIGLTVLKASYSISGALLYLVVPFLVIWCVILWFVRHVNLEKLAVYGSVTCLTVLFLIVLTGKFYPACFEKAFSAGWAGVCIGLIFLCIYQSKEMVDHAIEMMIV